MQKIYLATASAILLALTSAAGAREMDTSTHVNSLEQPVLLTDSELDDVSAAGQYSSSIGFASAELGRVMSRSMTRTFTYNNVSITISRSIARAIGIGVVAYTSATSGIAEQYSSSVGLASAAYGRAMSMSMTRTMTNNSVSTTMSRSIARAVGIGAVAYTSATSGIN